MTPTPGFELLRETLGSKARVATRDQAIRVLAKGGVASRRVAKRVLHALVGRGLVRFEEVPARPLLRLEYPLVTWRPGLPAPAFGPLAWTLEKRWQEPLRPTRVYFAGPAAVRAYGGCMKGRLSNIAQVSHDLHVTEVYLGFLEREPEIAAAWVSEDELGESRKKFEKQPDAVLYDRDGKPRVAVEFGGLYGVDKLQAFHTDMERRALPYELW
jgi:hypothetical protein